MTDGAFRPTEADWDFVRGLDQATEEPGHLPDELLTDGLGDRAALELLHPLAIGRARRLDRSDFFAHMDPPTPWITWVTAAWAASQNQNLLHVDTAPAARELEATVVAWLAPVFGMNGGHLTPGSTVANLTALWAARELRDLRRVVASAAAHVSVAKAAAILGLELETVPVDHGQAMDADALRRLGDLSDAAVVLTAGTTATGAVDPLRASIEAGWLHVDAAWTGPLALSSRHRHRLEGIERADSVAISGHKWLFQPKESGMVLFADTAGSHQAISFGGGYLANPNVGLLGSHGAGAALGLAVTCLSWGRRGIEQRIDTCMELADQLARAIEQSPQFELRNPPQCGVVVWRPIDGSVDDTLGRIDGVVVSRTVIDGEPWFRSVSANPMADPSVVLDTVGRASA